MTFRSSLLRFTYSERWQTIESATRSRSYQSGAVQNDSFVVTAEWIDEYATANGAWAASQLQQIGVTWPLRGWRRDEVGRATITEQNALFERRIC